MNNTNANATVRAKNELAYVFSFTDYVRKEILDNSYWYYNWLMKI